MGQATHKQNTRTANEPDLPYKKAHCAGCISANTKPHHQHWDDRRIGTAISCMVGDTWQTAMSKTPVAVRDSRQNQTQGPWPEIPSAITTVLQLLDNQWTPLVCWFDFYHFK